MVFRLWRRIPKPVTKSFQTFSQEMQKLLRENDCRCKKIFLPDKTGIFYLLKNYSRYLLPGQFLGYLKNFQKWINRYWNPSQQIMSFKKILFQQLNKNTYLINNIEILYFTHLLLVIFHYNNNFSESAIKILFFL